MKKIYLKPEAIVEVVEMDECVMLSTSEGAADDTPALGREFDEEDFSQTIMFIDVFN